MERLVHPKKDNSNQAHHVEILVFGRKYQGAEKLLEREEKRYINAWEIGGTWLNSDT